MSVSVPEGEGNNLSININASNRSLSDSSLDISPACNPGKNLLEICNASQITIMAIVQIELCSLMDFDSIVRKLPFDSDSLLSSLSLSSCSIAKDGSHKSNVQFVASTANINKASMQNLFSCLVFRANHGYVLYVVSKFCPKSFCELVDIFRTSNEIC